MKNLKASSISAILTFILIVFLTIYSELNESFKNMLASIFGHHWIGKCVLSFVFFFLVYFILNKIIKGDKNINKQINLVVITAIIGCLAIFLFFVYGFIK